MVVEALAPFRGTGELHGSMLVRGGLPLALARLELAGGLKTLDLDDPVVLQDAELRPSMVATRSRAITQPQAAALFRRHRTLGALLWWSTLEASWQNVTVFDRAAPALTVAACEPLGLDDAVVAQAAAFLGLGLPR